MNTALIKEYGDFLRKEAKFKKRMTVVFDCADGYVGKVIKEALRGVSNIRPIYLNARPDGSFPGRGPNPSAPGALDRLKGEVIAKKADLGAAYDGDADRVIFIDDKGREVDSDALLKFYIEEKGLKSIVVDFRIGWSVRDIKNVKIVRTKVGNYYIKKAMIENRVDFGAERTGHYYFKIKDAYVDGAVKMTLAVISLVSRRSSLSQIMDDYPHKYFRTAETNYSVKDKEASIRAIKEAYIRRKPEIAEIDGLTMEFEDFWFNVRPSAGEDLLRLNIEARSDSVLQKELKVIESLIK